MAKPIEQKQEPMSKADLLFAMSIPLDQHIPGDDS